jgi:hypothetical protein
VITTRTVQGKRSRRRLLLLVEAVKGNRFKYLYLVQHQEILTVFLEDIRHWGEATPFVFLMFLHEQKITNPSSTSSIRRAKHATDPVEL